MTNDIFCQLYGMWKQKGAIIYENNYAYALFSVTPASPGHSVVVSKPHVERIEQLRGESLEGFVDAMTNTRQAVQDIYAENPEQIIAFYEGLVSHPPTESSKEAAQRMLNHPHLRVRPDDAYNIGINVGGYAGQSVPHLHAQIFLRRGKGLGIVTAMQEFLKE